jgi:ribonuclease P protein component
MGSASAWPPGVDGPFCERGGSRGVIASRSDPMAELAVGRVRGRASFAGFRRPAGRASGPSLRVRYRAPTAADSGPPVKVAYAISKAFGPAVLRNRARRRLRHAVKEVVTELRTGSYLLLPERVVVGMDFAGLVRLVRDAMMEAAGGGKVPPGTVSGTGGAS